MKILNRIRSLHRKAKNVITDWCRKLAKEIIAKARRRRYAVALEDLTHLQKSLTRNEIKIVWRLKTFAYRKLHESIVSKAVEYDVPIIFVDPRNTSKTCPRCESTLLYVHRLAICGCGFVADRDIIGDMNVLLRSLHVCGGAWVAPERLRCEG